MNEKQIIESFQNYLKGKDLNEKSLSLQILPDLFINYYRDIEFNEVDKENDGDLLLFECGTYNWGDGNYFQINFTRQFYEVFSDDSRQIYQFGVTLFYKPEDFEDVTSFNQWSSVYRDLSEYRNVIINSLGYKRALEKPFIKQEVRLNLI